ncbi:MULTISPECIES: type II toxin-antitoxin system VapC family toxin [unclassified Luteococcus]|uniref:type II toxin-antitoxin system VapC family toxin n=1 Tax=unclassified Luteococcus TaxID=2639923 RepID=UPI00313DF9D4
MSGHRFLLDTNALLRLLEPDLGSLGPQTVEYIRTASAGYYSAASIWEIMIKQAKGRLAITADFFDGLRKSRLRELAVTTEFVRHLDALQLDHADPFDRLIATQASVEGIVLITTDQRLLAAAEVATLDAHS